MQASIIRDVAAPTCEEPTVYGLYFRILWPVVGSVQSYAPIRIDFTAREMHSQQNENLSKKAARI